MLCRTTTSDGLLLDGALLTPSVSTGSAFVFVHGTGSNFYAPGILEQLAQAAFAAGHIALRINTRGHDGIASIPTATKSVKGGATYEVVADCTHDITAWCDFLTAKGINRITLVGHSMGGVKAIYSQAHAPHAAVSRIVCLSPPRFCHQHWMSHPQGAAFRQHFEHAQSLVAAGLSETLFECRQPTPFLATAAGFIEKYGPDDRYDFISLLPSIRVPVVVLLGDQSQKESPAFDSHAAELARLASEGVTVSFRLMAGTSMNYSGRAVEVWDVLNR